MLMLSRKQNESIVIDGEIEIEVLKVHGQSVRLGIRAPKNVAIRRCELNADVIDHKDSDVFGMK